MLVCVLEDSSRNAIGGGQFVTLDVIKIIEEIADIVVVDTAENSLFAEKAKQCAIDEFWVIKKEKTFLKTCFALHKVFQRIINLYKANNKKAMLYAATKKMLVFAFVLNFLCGIKYVFHAHMAPKSNYERILLQILLLNVSAVICVSKTVKDFLSVKNSFVLYNPVKPPDYSVTKKNSFYLQVSFIGSLIKIKGVEYFIQAANGLADEKIIFNIFGSGPLEESLKLKTENKNVVFHGFVHDKAYIYSNTDIIVLPTIIKEACPLVVLEAAALGIPLITTNIGGQQELFQLLNFSIGKLIKACDANELRESILNVRDMIRQGMNTLNNNIIEKRFSSENFKDHIKDFFNSVML